MLCFEAEHRVSNSYPPSMVVFVEELLAQIMVEVVW